MKLNSIIGDVDNYSNLSQKIRVTTEGWGNRAAFQSNEQTLGWRPYPPALP
jgi:hypothetical protein